MSLIKEQKTIINGGWYHMDDAPKHCLIEVFCPAKNGVPGMFAFVRWHEDAGFTVDEILEPTMWRFV